MSANDKKRHVPSSPSLAVSALSRNLGDLRSPPQAQGSESPSPIRNMLLEAQQKPGQQFELPLRAVRRSLGQALADSNKGTVDEKQGAGDVGGSGGGPAHVKPMTNADGIGALADTDRKAQSRDRRYDSPVDAVMEAQSPNQAPAVKPQGGMSLGKMLADIKSQPKPDRPKPDGGIPPRPPRRRM